MAPMIQERVFQSKEALQAATAAEMRLMMEAPHDSPAGIMVPGGSTPGPVFAALARDPFKVSPNFRLLYTDERHVPKNSEDSNYRLTLPLIEGLSLKPGQVIAAETGGSLEEDADRWDARWRAYLSDGGHIALAFLGMGPDTHTCSLFTDEDLARSAGRFALAVNRPKPPPKGISVTPSLLECAERVIFLVTGEDKIAAADQLRDNPLDTIAGKAVADCKHVALWRSH